MRRVYVLMSGGVWLSESRDRIGEILALGEMEKPRSERRQGEPPLHCVIGGSGYRVGKWPKEGYFCAKCLSFFVNPKPY